MGAELATTTQAGGRALVAAEALTQEAEQRELLGRFIRSQMVEGEDFGVIPGTKKKTLLKPGAEKLASLFRCTPQFELVRSIEDWERPLFHYEFKCRIVHQESGQVVAEGVGSANSRESKWRWRQADRACPQCGKPTIIKGKEEYGGGWVCFFKKGGCGAKFADDDESIASQPVGRVENPDVFDCVNTILKIAKKRALVDGSVALGRCSDLFTQDVEEGMDDPSPTPPARQAPARNAAANRARFAQRFAEVKTRAELEQVTTDVARAKRSGELTEADLDHLRSLARQAGARFAAAPAPAERQPGDDSAEIEAETQEQPTT